MPTTWKTVRVFISSTFRDMHAERDHLIRVVFPELRERLEAHHVHLVDIDLRWGVTREQADNDLVLDLCLEEIDRCRPFFVGILGQRYGWVPASFPDPAVQQYGWIQGMTGRSITELEILHGVLNNPKMVGRSLFLFRKDDYLADVPEDVQRDVYLDEHPDKLEAIKEKIVDYCERSGTPLHRYDCRWDPECLSPEDGRRGRVVGLEQFGEWVRDELWEGITREHPQTREELPEPAVPGTAEWLPEEQDYHERFVESRTQVYVGRDGVHQELLEHLEGGSNAPLLLVGGSGTGKSAILARLWQEWTRGHPGDFCLGHFVGASPFSANLRLMLRRFCLALAKHFRLEPQVPEEVEKLPAAFRDFLGSVPDGQRAVLIIDAVNQLDAESRAHEMRWLPRELPAGVSIVISCLEEPGKALGPADALRRRGVPELRVGPLTDEERLEIALRVPSVAAKTLDPEQVQLLLRNPATRNPLYLLVALEELRGFGSYEQLGDRVASLPHQEGEKGITELFAQVIGRLEQELGRDLVHTVLTSLACSRIGLSERELSELLTRERSGPDDESERWGQLQILLRQLRAYLLRRGPLVHYYHRGLHTAAAEQLLQGASAATGTGATAAAQGVHRVLGTYFQAKGLGSRRMLEEAPYHMARGAMWESLEGLLCGLGFVEAKLAAGLSVELLTDYTTALQMAPSGLPSEARIAEFGRFVSHELHFLRQHPHLVYQQAHNSPFYDEVRAVTHKPDESARLGSSAWLNRAPGSVRQRHSGSVAAMSFWGGDNHLAVSTDSRQVWVWDVDAGQVLRRCATPPSAVRALAASPDGALLAGGFGGPEPSPFVSGVLVWQAEGGVLHEFSVADWVYSVRWWGDGNIVAGVGMPSGSEAHGAVWVGEVGTGAQGGVTGVGGERPIVLTWDGAQLSQTPQAVLMALSRDGFVHCIAPDAPESALARLDLESLFDHVVGTAVRQAVAIGGGGIAVLTGDGIFIVRVVAVLDQLMGQGTRLETPWAGDTTCLAAHPKGDRLAVGTASGQVWVVHVSAGSEAQKVSGDGPPVTAVCFSPNGDRVAWGDALGRVSVAQCLGGALLLQTQARRSARAARIDGRRACVLHGDRLEVTATTGAQVRYVVPVPENMVALDFDHTDDLAVLLCRPSDENPRTLHRYVSVASMVGRCVLLSLRAPLPPVALSKAETLMAPSPYLSIRVTISDDGYYALLHCGQGIVVQSLLSIDRGRPLVVPRRLMARDGIVTVMKLTPDIPPLSCDVISVSGDGLVAAAGYTNNSRWPASTGEVRVWDLSSAEAPVPLEFPAPITAICSRVRDEAIIGTRDGAVSSWRHRGHWQRCAVVHHSLPVVAAGSTSDGRIACSASGEGTIRVWETSTGQCLLQTFLDVRPIAIGFIDGDGGLCLVDSDGDVHIWHIERRDLLPYRLGASGDPASGSAAGTAKGPRPCRSVQYLGAARRLRLVQSHIEEGHPAGARQLLVELVSTPRMAETIGSWHCEVDNAEAWERVPEQLKTALTELGPDALSWQQSALDPGAFRRQADLLTESKPAFEQLLRTGHSRQARALASSLPATNNSTASVRHSWLANVDAVEFPKQWAAAAELFEQGRLQEALDTALRAPAPFQLIDQVRQLIGACHARLGQGAYERGELPLAVEHVWQARHYRPTDDSVRQFLVMLCIARAQKAVVEDDRGSAALYTRQARGLGPDSSATAAAIDHIERLVDLHLSPGGSRAQARSGCLLGLFQWLPHG